jgi:NAD(P)-dependent dehydrogenase (short-subunit alcohol dehydrogenase family)
VKLKDKVAIVTGASRGIGRAVATRYADEGARVIAVARNEELLNSLQEQLAKNSRSCAKIVADVSTAAECQRITAEAIGLYGRVDVLVNNAGILGKRIEIISFDLADWQRVFDVNVHAVFMLSKLAAIEMVKQRAGSIINVTSGVVPRPRTEWGAYLPSKFAVEGLSLMLSQELKDTGVRVNMIDPGRTNTDMIRVAYPNIDPFTFKPPEEITEPFVFLASDEARLVTGTRIQVR